MRKNYVEKVYAGLLGMNIGIRLGAPVEPSIWTYERIRDTYGDITQYVKEFLHFAADDDANGPYYFLRALYDKASNRPLAPSDVADAWLNYAREGVGMFWWGGYGRSTEHTAYLNLKMGIPAPQSGSIAQNGATMAEQIGGQIFIDTWGLIYPSNPEKAAEYGQIAASVSHDGEGLLGARFFCAAIARAFDTEDVRDILRTALAQLPQDSLYVRVAAAVEAFYKAHPDDWRACLGMLHDQWGYDRYPGACHIIPNAGVCILSMLYGQGDFARTVEIATMCGWDTDCNAGNVGTVLGVAKGLAGLPAHYRAPINDMIILSGISGDLNIQDLPTWAREVALLGYAQAGETPPDSLRQSVIPGELHFDFDLPGSTHGICLSDPFFCRMEYSADQGIENSGCLKILVDRMSRGDQCKVFYKPFYTRADFSDERYMPVFTPKVYSGQTLSCKLFLDQWEGWETLGVAPYIRTRADKRERLGGYVKLVPAQWTALSFVLPDTQGDLIDEVGFVIEGYSIAKAKSLGYIHLDDFAITGKPTYTIDMAKQKKEFGSVTPFAIDHGAWDLERGALTLMCCEPSFAYAGRYDARDVRVTVPVTPLNGDSHLLLLRAKGALWGYAAGLSANGTVTLYKNDHGYAPLCATAFPWIIGETYTLTFSATGDRLTLSVDGQPLLDCRDDSFAYGMIGCGSLRMGRTAFGNFIVEELAFDI